MQTRKHKRMEKRVAERKTNKGKYSSGRNQSKQTKAAVEFVLFFSSCSLPRVHHHSYAIVYLFGL